MAQEPSVIDPKGRAETEMIGDKPDRPGLWPVKQAEDSVQCSSCTAKARADLATAPDSAHIYRQ